MVFSVPELSSKRFDFKLPGNKKVYSLPLTQDLPLSIKATLMKAIAISERVQKMEKRGREYEPSQDEVEILASAQTAILDRYAPGVSEQISEAQFKALMEAWAEASSVTLGESAPSSH